MTREDRSSLPFANAQVDGVADLEPGPTAVLAAGSGAAATLVPGASGTLAAPEIWGHLLSEDRWSDAAPARPTTLSDIVERLHSEP